MDYGITHSFDEGQDCWQVKVTGEVDIYNHQQFKDTLTGLAKEKAVALRIDCSGLSYIDSTGLGALVAVLKNVREYGGSIYLVNVHQNLGKLLKITNLNKVFNVEQTAAQPAAAGEGEIDG